MKDLAVAVVMFAAFIGVFSYPLKMSRGSIAGADVFTVLTCIVVFSICIGYFTKYNFVAMVVAFALQMATLAFALVLV